MSVFSEMSRTALEAAAQSMALMLDEIGQDKARLDWLSDNAGKYIGIHTYAHRFTTDVLLLMGVDFGEPETTHEGDTLRQAIDRAREGEKP